MGKCITNPMNMNGIEWIMSTNGLEPITSLTNMNGEMDNVLDEHEWNRMRTIWVNMN